MTTTRRAAPRHPAVSSRAATGLVLFGFAVVVIDVFDLEALVAPHVVVPPWAVFALPALLYAAVAAIWMFRRSLGHVAGAFAILFGGHWALTALTAGVETLIEGSAYMAAMARVAWGMPLLGAIQLLLVPFSLLPVCRRLMPPPRPVRAGVPGRAVPRTREAQAWVAAPAAERSSASPQPAALAPTTFAEDDEEAVFDAPVPAAAANGNGTPEPPRAPAIAAPPREGSHPTSAERVEDVVRVRFDRVAGQLPAAVFLLPIERIGANLLEPDHLLVPQRLVAPQLGEGIVRVSWDVVADQFPRQALALPDAEIARKIPNGCLVLPLDEIVRQLPAQVFMLSSPTTDVRRLEDFPLPFQPHVPTADEAPAPEGAAPETAAPDATPPGFEPTAQHAAAPLASDPAPMTPDPVAAGRNSPPRPAPPAIAPESPPAPVSSAFPVVAAAPSEPAVSGHVVAEKPATPEWAPPRQVPAEPVTRDRAVPDRVPQARAAAEASAPEQIAPERPAPVRSAAERSVLERIVAERAMGERARPELVEPPTYIEEQSLDRYEPERPVDRAPEPERMAPARSFRVDTPRAAPRRVDVAEVATHLTPVLGPIDVDQRYLSGVTLTTAVGAGVDGEAAVATAGPILPLLADPRLPWAINQATVRANTGSLILTPVGPLERGGNVLLAAVTPGGPLAMVERASLRIAGVQESEDPAPAMPSSERLIDPDLRAAAIPANVRAVAESLRAFGRVTPAVLRDHAGTLLMYLFLPPDADPRVIAGFARDLRRHCEGSPLGSVASVIARVGLHRLVVWELDAGRSCASVLVAFGPVDRPGLARIELERAALRLAAL
jgi:hypothetical protein